MPYMVQPLPPNEKRQRPRNNLSFGDLDILINCDSHRLCDYEFEWLLLVSYGYTSQPYFYATISTPKFTNPQMTNSLSDNLQNEKPRIMHNHCNNLPERHVAVVSFCGHLTLQI